MTSGNNQDQKCGEMIPPHFFFLRFFPVHNFSILHASLFPCSPPSFLSLFSCSQFTVHCSLFHPSLLTVLFALPDGAGMLPAWYRNATGLIPGCYRIDTGMIPRWNHFDAGSVPYDTGLIPRIFLRISCTVSSDSPLRGSCPCGPFFISSARAIASLRPFTVEDLIRHG